MKDYAKLAKTNNGLKGDETTRQLCFILLGKIDDNAKRDEDYHHELRKELIKANEGVVKNKTGIKYLRWMFGISITLLLAIIGYFLNM